MVKYRYVKKYTWRLFGKNSSYYFRLFSLLFSLLGLFLVGNAVTPVISYQVNLSPAFREKEVLSPVNADWNNINYSVFNQILGQQTQEELMDVRKWFPQMPYPSINPNKKEITSFKLSIPSLKINEATVKLGVENLDKNLVQYPGTGVPGLPGNMVIFGHSVLPQFFNPNNYKTIFSTLPTIEKKSEILVDFDEVRYTYLVEEMKEYSPNDVSIITQRYDDSYISLVTCVPPGTYLRRLVVRARLTK